MMILLREVLFRTCKRNRYLAGASTGVRPALIGRVVAAALGTRSPSLGPTPTPICTSVGMFPLLLLTPSAGETMAGLLLLGLVAGPPLRDGNDRPPAKGLAGCVDGAVVGASAARTATGTSKPAAMANR